MIKQKKGKLIPFGYNNFMVEFIGAHGEGARAVHIVITKQALLRVVYLSINSYG
jgi:hypothetical protein